MSPNRGSALSRRHSAPPSRVRLRSERSRPVTASEKMICTSSTLVFDESLDYDFQLAAMNISIPLIDTGDAAIGWMDPQVWERMQEILLEQGIIPAPVDLSTVYTNRFVNQTQ